MITLGEYEIDMGTIIAGHSVKNEFSIFNIS